MARRRLYRAKLTIAKKQLPIQLLFLYDINPIDRRNDLQRKQKLVYSRAISTIKAGSQ